MDVNDIEEMFINRYDRKNGQGNGNLTAFPGGRFSLPLIRKLMEGLFLFTVSLGNVSIKRQKSLIRNSGVIR